MPNALTTEVGFKVGPVLLEVLAKHYFERLKKEPETEGEPKLRQDNILYDEAFSIVKSFLNVSSLHTVEDLQAFSNTRTPSPPWIHVVRTLVPMSSCDQAATYLINALGGEATCRRVVGGVKWWQVRGINGVDAQWITARKDWREAKRRHKQHREHTANLKHEPSSTESMKADEGTYSKEMDAMRCILYIHGGGYYFGSVDQERYSIQRLARKTNGRVFAINYRLAPQYPFPCAIQDALAAYLYLIRPPAGAEHQPVDPAHIVISGDSAGGGLSLALLQVIRDAGLPKPAGGLLVSPWCDLTHSFPSIHLNTTTDIIPDGGLSFHKPSTLWPPPPPEVSYRVHASLRHRIRQAFRLDDNTFESIDTVVSDYQHESIPGQSVDVGATTSVPPLNSRHPETIEKISLTTSSNETLEIENQIHFYTRNSLLIHPLVSPALAYLGDLPPLFFIASDKEVLRDEAIYTAHRAANPSKYSIAPRSGELYPISLTACVEMKPTSVHLQVYDDTAHILPILFSFTTPAKFCFRAMANFCKFVTGVPLTPPIPSFGPNDHPLRSGGQPPHGQDSQTTSPRTSVSVERETDKLKAIPIESGTLGRSLTVEHPSRPSLRRAISSKVSRASIILRHRSYSAITDRKRMSFNARNDAESQILADVAANSSRPDLETTSSDVGGPRFSFSAPSLPAPGERFAGEVFTYLSIKDYKHWECGMIRERVATSGVIRPLESEDQLEALTFPDSIVGCISELALRRYIQSQAKYDTKFAHTYKSIEKHRRRNLERSKHDTIKQVSHIRKTIKDKENGNGMVKHEGFKDYLLSSPGWSWAWALDEHENPPPSSIVSRRDTEEARKLAEIADQAILGEGHTFSGNNLWSVVINFLTVTPGKPRIEISSAYGDAEDVTEAEKRRSKFSRMFSWDRPHDGRDRQADR